MKTDNYRGDHAHIHGGEDPGVSSFGALGIHLSGGWPTSFQPVCFIVKECRGDAVLAMQEVIAKYLRSGSRIYMCLYDLQKAFDLVEYPVLLEKLFVANVNGKIQRLFKNCYESCFYQVKLDGRLSDIFSVERGVKQGSVLIPCAFLSGHGSTS